MLVDVKASANMAANLMKDRAWWCHNAHCVVSPGYGSYKDRLRIEQSPSRHLGMVAFNNNQTRDCQSSINDNRRSTFESRGGGFVCDSCSGSLSLAGVNRTQTWISSGLMSDVMLTGENRNHVLGNNDAPTCTNSSRRIKATT